MRRTHARHSAATALALVLGVALCLATITTAAAGGKGGSTSGKCRKNCPTILSTPTTLVGPTTTSTTIPAPTTTTTVPADPTPPPASVDPADVVIEDPSASGELSPLLRTRLITFGSVTGVLYLDVQTYTPSVWFRDSATLDTSIVDLPSDARQGWVYAAAVMTSPNDLWIAGGSGPITLRHYVLSGAPLPTSATRVETRTFGTTDSRPGDMIALTSGAIVLAWHQQGASGPQGQQVAYRSAAGDWSQLPNLDFMPSHFSDQVLAQHPVDGSVWLFSNPDMFGAIGAAHLSETASGLAVDWTNAEFISSRAHGTNGPDPENADLAVTSDPATGTIAVAYQSSDRQYVGPSSNVEVVSRPVIARVPVSGAPSFTTAPVWAERVADIGLVVAGGDTWLTYREVDHDTGSLLGIHAVHHGAGGWEAPVALANGSVTSVAYGTGRVELVAKPDDQRIHVLALTA